MFSRDPKEPTFSFVGMLDDLECSGTCAAPNKIHPTLEPNSCLLRHERRSAVCFLRPKTSSFLHWTLNKCVWTSMFEKSPSWKLSVLLQIGQIGRSQPACGGRNLHAGLRYLPRPVSCNWKRHMHGWLRCQARRIPLDNSPSPSLYQITWQCQRDMLLYRKTKTQAAAEH